MWKVRSKELAGGHGVVFNVEKNGSVISYAEAITGLQNDREFRLFLNDKLAQSSFSAFRWETPPVSSENSNRVFEFAILGASGLADVGDPTAFAKHFSRPGSGDAVTFMNLGHDAMLVVPCPQGSAASYGHLGAFVRTAPRLQQDAFWMAVGHAMQQRIGTRPVWLSTAGAGVPWLHVRLDDRPKYYGHEPYRAFEKDAGL